MNYKKETIEYSMDGYDIDVTNIFVTVDVSDIRDEYIKWYALSGESAQSASLKLYDSSEYYWILYLLNDVVNPHEDWYMSPSQLRRYAEIKYDEPDAPNSFYYVTTGEYLTHKLSLDMMYLYEQGMQLPAEVLYNTNYDYEVSMNESKKVIKTIKSSKILEFMNIYNERLRNL